MWATVKTWEGAISLSPKGSSQTIFQATLTDNHNRCNSRVWTLMNRPLFSTLSSTLSQTGLTVLPIWEVHPPLSSTLIKMSFLGSSKSTIGFSRRWIRWQLRLTRQAHLRMFNLRMFLHRPGMKIFETSLIILFDIVGSPRILIKETSLHMSSMMSAQAKEAHFRTMEMKFSTLAVIQTLKSKYTIIWIIG